MKFLAISKNKSVFLLRGVILFALVIGWHTVIKAQTAGFEAGLAGQMSTVLGNGILSNSISENSVETAKRRVEAARINAVSIRGAKIIAAGKATNSFIPTLAATKQFAESLTYDADEPQDAAGQLQLIQGFIAKFNDYMKQNKLIVNDVAEGVALAHAIAYIATYNQKPDSQEMRAYRLAKHQEFLDSEYFQGLTDAKKQEFYESNAVAVIQAINYRMQANEEKNMTKKKQLEEKAKYFAQNLL